MGDIAEMMLDGDLCEACGSYIDDMGGDGIPRYCSSECAADRGMVLADDGVAISPERPQRTPTPKVKCLTCGKRVKKTGLRDHMKDAHGPDCFEGQVKK